MLTTPQGDEEEDADTYRVASRATFMITSAPSASESPCCILFTDTEVILDNAAGQSVFKNPALLHAIVSTPSVSLGGVNSQSPRLEISSKGEFGDLGSVGVSWNATANILSQGQAMQDGARINDRSLRSTEAEWKGMDIRSQAKPKRTQNQLLGT